MVCCIYDLSPRLAHPATVKEFGNTTSRMHFLFQLQHKRFLIWGQSFDILGAAEKLDALPPTLQEIVIQTLMNINDLVKSASEVAEKYGLRIAEQTTAVMDTNRSEAVRRIQRQATLVYRVHKSADMFRRIRWVVYDRQRFQSLVDHLTRLIDALYEMCPVRYQRHLDSESRAEALIETIINNLPIQAEPTPSQSRSDPINVAHDTMNAYYRFNVVDQAETASNGPIYGFRPSPDIFISDDRVRISEARDIRRGMGIYHPSSGAAHRSIAVLVEWRPFSLMNLDENARVQMHRRIDSIVRLLQPGQRPGGFRVLDCVAYFEDSRDSRFGLVYKVPEEYSSAPGFKPVTLYELLRRSDRVPFLEERLSLATTLAECLHDFISTKWLHRSINAHNVLFFRDVDKEARAEAFVPTSLKQAYFSGLGAARPDNNTALSSQGAVETSVGIYRHPDVMGQGQPVARYNVMHDIYSLGTVLLEIGTWTRHEKRYVRGTPARAFRTQLLDIAVPQLGPAVGSRYMIVVKKCLEGYFEGLSNFRGDEEDYHLNLTRAFYWEVVDVLKSYKV